MYSVEEFDAVGFLGRAEGFLRSDEARHNLMLGLALGRATAAPDDEAFFATVSDSSGRVVSCVLRTPPHKVLLTDLPMEAVDAVVDRLSARYDAIPSFLGPPSAEALARAWAGRHGGVCRPGMAQGVYRVDEVIPPPPPPGAIRAVAPGDIDLVVRWGEGFARDTGVGFPKGREPIVRWMETGALFVWEVEGEPVSVAVAHGRTWRGIRIGYVYTPPERRGRGYASALVAEVSRRMLGAGCEYCVLYTDLSNPTSNAVYRRVGYRLIDEVRDYDVIGPPGAERPGT